MAEAIGRFFSEILGKHLSVLLCSMLPIIELRGAIPLSAVFRLPWYEAFPLCYLGNMLPIPFILLFIRAFLDFLRRFRLFRPIVDFVDRKAEKAIKGREGITFWGLVVFVAIPLPGTGGWTGALAAAFLKIPFRKSLLAIAVGVLIADVVVSVIVYGGVTALSFLV